MSRDIAWSRSCCTLLIASAQTAAQASSATPQMHAWVHASNCLFPRLSWPAVRPWNSSFLCPVPCRRVVTGYVSLSRYSFRHLVGRFVVSAVSRPPESKSSSGPDKAARDEDRGADFSQGKREPKVKTPILVALTIFFAVLNRVAYKMQVSGPMGQYSIFVCLATTFCYLLIYFPVLALRILRGRVPLSQFRQALCNARYFTLIGILEALTFTLQLAAAAHIPGSLLPILGQAILPFSMTAAVFILGRRYSLSQVAGVAVVMLGVIIGFVPTLSLPQGHNIATKSIVFAVSYVFLSFAIVLKEVALQGRLKRATGALAEVKSSGQNISSTPYDVFIVNSFCSTAQFIATVLLLPVTFVVGAGRIAARKYIADGFRLLFNAPMMPWLTVWYVVCNVIFNIFGLTLMKQASSTVALIATVGSLPLVSLAFCLPLPLLARSHFSWATCASLAIVILGVYLYNAAPASSKTSSKLSAPRDE